MERMKAKRKAERDAKKAAIWAEDMANGVLCTVDMLPKAEPKVIKKAV